MRTRTLAAAAAVAALAAACGSPRMALIPSWQAGEERVYALESTATTDFDVPGLDQTESTRVEATVRVHVRSVDDDGVAIVSVSLTPTAFERDGRAADPPAPQEASLTVAADGRVTAVRTPAGTVAPLGGSAEDLGGLLGTPIRRGRVKLGDRWRSETATGGSRSSRVAALRFEEGYRCAIVSTATARPVARERESAGGTLQLSGTETSSTETAFAFDRGLPVRISAAAEGRFTVQGSPQGGRVTIATATTLRLRERRTGVTASPSPSPSPSVSRTPAIRPRPSATATPAGSPTR